MSFSILFPLVPAVIGSILWSYFVYPLLFSPLRRIPSAHPVASLSTLWIRYHRLGGSQALAAISRAHALHGPIIRLSPSELSISSQEALKKVYIEKGGFAKPKWWGETFASFGVINMVSMQGGVGNKEHAERKRDLGSVYAKSVLMGSEVLRGIAKKVLKEMDAVMCNAGNREIEVFNFNGAIAADFASAYIYGANGATDFLKEVEIRDKLFQSQSAWLKEKPGHVQAQKYVETYGFERCSIAERAVGDEEKGLSNTNAIVFKQLRIRGLRGKDMASETLDHFVAGSEAPKVTLTYLNWELSKRLDLQARLRDELHNISSSPDRVPDFKVLDSLPLLDAILSETLRLYVPTPGAQFRITPPEGTTLHGFFIPGGVQISASLAVLHKNGDVFEDPEVWMPERWLTADKDKLEEMRRWSWWFSKGSRICIGKDFAVIVMKLIVATLYSKYETEVVDDAGMEQEDKSFIAGPVGEKLILRLQPVG